MVPHQTIQAENDLIYKNNQLGIEIHFPQTWKGKYVISEDIAAKKVDVKFITGDILFGVVFLTEDDWIAQQVGGAVRKIAERNGYVLVLWKPTEAPYQLPKDKLKEFVDISNESSISWASWVRITSSFDTKLFQSQTRAQITKLNEKNVLSILASRLDLLEEDLEWVGEHPSKAGGWIQSLSHPNERWIVNLQTGDVYLGLSSNNSLRGPYLFNLLDNQSSK
ncbi:hypothetical protein [Paenibacillus sp. FSL H8-0034]|uniref:hypothetical protein n=1 Tax=Paenibacillus sp. FSL H8-0034 TaxID=2954671 RepID=UPI0030F89F5A